MNETTTPVTVQILEKEYRIACTVEHKESLKNSAILLNDKMHEIRKSGKVIGSDRIAVMAALNLAHDLLQQKTNNHDDQLQQQLQQMRAKIEKVVSSI
jgi:cell division protein ZapA